MGEELPGGTDPRSIPDCFPKDALQRLPMSSLFAERGIIFALLIPSRFYRRNLRTTGTKTSTTSKAISSGVILLRH